MKSELALIHITAQQNDIKTHLFIWAFLGTFNIIKCKNIDKNDHL